MWRSEVNLQESDSNLAASPFICWAISLAPCSEWFELRGNPNMTLTCSEFAPQRRPFTDRLSRALWGLIPQGKSRERPVWPPHTQGHRVTPGPHYLKLATRALHCCRGYAGNHRTEAPSCMTIPLPSELSEPWAFNHGGCRALCLSESCYHVDLPLGDNPDIFWLISYEKNIS